MANECRAGLAIVEDEKGLVDVLLRLFAKRNIRVCFVAYDGGDAILKFIQSTPKPHIIIMDYRLPTVNGIDAMKEILKIDPETRIILLSADIDIKEEALKKGGIRSCERYYCPRIIKEIPSTVPAKNRHLPMDR